VACLSRPLEADELLRELDFLVAAPRGLAGAHLQKVAASRWKGEQRRPRVHPGLTANATPPSALLIDESQAALRDLDGQLNPWLLQTEHALTSSRAIERLSQRHFDLIFLDIDLGTGPQSSAGLDGLALCRHIKRRASGVQSLHTAVFLLSTEGGELDRVRGMLAGCDACLRKPPPDTDLQRLLLGHGLVLREDARAG
jgi:CheY-like chemotaxis protein